MLISYLCAMVKQKSTLQSSQNDTGRATPYAVRTPRTGDAYIPNRSRSTSERERELRLGEDLVKKTWCVHSVSPLQNFSYNNRKLEEYSDVLASHLEKGKTKNFGIHIGQHTKYKVQFCIVKQVTCSKADSDAIKINVLHSSVKENDKSIFTGFLLSVNRVEEYWENLRSKLKCTKLPLFLTNGPVHFKTHVLNFLQDHFACSVRPIRFSTVDLMWMLTLWSGIQNVVKPSMLEYSLPFEELHTIQYSISSSSIKNIWTRMHNVNASTLNGMEVLDFIKNLEKHFLGVFSIDLSNFQLRSIGTEIAAVHRKGSIKIYEAQYVTFILQHLTRLSQEVNDL